MGANAVTTVPVYTAGEVLTAADMNITNSGIPVFASTVERDAAFGGTGEKTLAEGQFAYLETGNVTQYYDGAAWQSVGVTPGLVLITAASFSAVASVSFPTSTFTSAYKAYRVVYFSTSVSDTTITMRFRAAGSDNTTNAYRAFTLGMSYAGAATNIAGGSNTSMTLGNSQGGGVGLTAFFDLNEISAAIPHPVLGYALSNDSSASVGYRTGMSFSGSTAFDSMSFISSSGNISGYYRVYGYSES
jgi:hypothetical protein